ncbi:uncharacterized protein LOC134214133 [Armigeres subalbatus]|uniref:uncharacterized protein LOC134214133 n=1 Tax=Armigeres subalbatus TaxID=124917 RepID=UPI002ED38599
MEYNLRTVTKSCKKYQSLRFPLKIWILVNAGGNRSLFWDTTKLAIMVNPEALQHYLASCGSIFAFNKLETFHWLMEFNGFELDRCMGEKTGILRYKHPSFTGENRAKFEQLLRSPQQREVQDGRRSNCSIQRTSILKQSDTDRSDSEIIKSQVFASIALEKSCLLTEIESLVKSVREAYNNLAKTDGTDAEVPIIEVPDKYCDEAVADIPLYNKQRIIAGNYGRVNSEDLKRFFGDYFPVYEDSPGPMDSETLVDQPKENSPEMATNEVSEETTTEVDLTSSPEPTTNTLETFDYQNNQEAMRNDLKNFNTSDMHLLGFGDETEGFAQVKHSASSLADTDQMNEAQFQLYSDIRATLDMLNQI